MRYAHELAPVQIPQESLLGEIMGLSKALGGAGVEVGQQRPDQLWSVPKLPSSLIICWILRHL